jgi:DNA-directed RNA polymerase specialized sigma24 family protein
VKRGERARDFAEAAERHLDDVHAYLVYLTGDRATAEDLTAETFARALERLVARNLSELEPPRIYHRLTASHPTPAERIAAAREAADAAKEGGFLGFHAQRVSEGEQRMLDQLAGVLGGPA